MIEAGTGVAQFTAGVPEALSRLMGEAAAMGAGFGLCPAPTRRVGPDCTLVHEGATLRTIYLVASGHFKTVRNGEDGYEQVLDFVGAGGLLGCDGLADGRHASGAVALDDAGVMAWPLAQIQQACRGSASFAARWQAAIALQIARADDRAWVMSAVGAEKRLARFLLMMGRREALDSASTWRLRLPMSRRDLGSHLGLSHESVSRSFTLLDEVGLLTVNNRAVVIPDPEALRSFASSTRGYAALRRALAADRSAASAPVPVPVPLPACA